MLSCIRGKLLRQLVLNFTVSGELPQEKTKRWLRGELQLDQYFGLFKEWSAFNF